MKKTITLLVLMAGSFFHSYAQSLVNNKFTAVAKAAPASGTHQLMPGLKTLSENAPAKKEEPAVGTASLFAINTLVPEKILLHYSGSQTVQTPLYIYSATGALVKTFCIRLSRDNNSLYIDVSTLQSGLYLLSINAPTGNFTQRFIKP